MKLASPIVAVLICCLPLSAQAFQVRKKIPADDSLKQAEALMTDVFGTLIDSAKEDDQKVAAAQKLRAAAKDSQSNVEDHFVLIRMAQKLAIQAGDSNLAMLIAKDFVEYYDCDEVMVVGKTLRQITEQSLTLKQREALARHGVEQMHAARVKKRYLEAKSFGEMARVAARRVRDYRLANQVSAELKELEEKVAGYQVFEKAIEDLVDNESDPQANLIAGKYFCFELGDWAQGLPCFTLSDDAAYTELAGLEFEANDSEEHKIKLGDKWWTQSQTLEGTEKQACMLRAGAWYKTASNTNGLVKVKIDQRLRQIEALGLPLPAIRGVSSATGVSPSTIAASTTESSGSSSSNENIYRGGNRPVTRVQLQRTLIDAAGSKMLGVTFSPDSNLLVGVGGSQITIWNTQTGQVLRKQIDPNYSFGAVQFSPDGSTIAVINVGSVKFFDTQTGSESEIPNSKKWLKGIAYSPNGNQLAFGGDEKTLFQWDLIGDRQIRSWDGTGGYVFSADYSPNGEVLSVSGSGSTIRCFDPATGRKIRELNGHSDRIWSIDYSPDGKMMVSGSADKQVIIWDTQLHKPRHILSGHTKWVRAVAFAPDGVTAASGGYDHQVRLWNAVTGRPIAILSDHKRGVECVAFSPNGQWLASCDGEGKLMLWSLRRDGK